MEHQMSLFEITDYDPVRGVAFMSTPYWTTSREKIAKAVDEEIKSFTKTVKEEYCPYGFVGHYGAANECPAVEEYEMKAAGINITYLDAEGYRQVTKCKWRDFARAIAELIAEGIYNY